jgi:beta-N-acetylhexosaminidase
MQATFYGFAGERLTEDERAFFRDSNPAGYIVFRRNISSPDQLRALTSELRAIHGRDDLPVLIDQEGGRVARMRPPHWPEFPSAGRFAALYRQAPMTAIEAARANAQAIAGMLREVGVNVDCLPVLDVAQEGAHEIIGDRGFGSEPMQVAALGRAVLEGLAAGGIVGVVKHMPGHGRALSDSHLELPVVDATEEELAIDLAPFRTLRNAPMGMTSHVLYTAWDAERPASQSPVVIGDVIRQRIGFDNFLMSDDLGMEALSGGPGERARLVVEAGCDAGLHCSGVFAEMVEVAAAVPAMSEESRTRLDRAMATIAAAPDSPSYAELADKRDRLLASA